MVFSSDAAMISEVKDRLAQFLREGVENADPALDLIGLDGRGPLIVLAEGEEPRPDANSPDFVGLRFQMSEGTGTVEDPAIYQTARVIFSDDDLPGVPCIRITLVGEEEMHRTLTRAISAWKLKLDCLALASEGALTAGAEARSAEDILASYARRMLRAPVAGDALDALGLRELGLVVNEEKSKDELFRNPMTVEFITVQAL